MNLKMQNLTSIQFWKKALAAFLVAFAVSNVVPARAENDPYFYAVMVSAQVSSNPARITLSWAADNNATGYTIARKAKTATSWTQVATIGNVNSWTDSNVAVGQTYEYGVTRSSSLGYTGTGYVFAGIEAPLVDARGKVILVVDNTYAAQLATELTRLQQDLVGDGWTVIRKDVSRTTSAPNVKALIKAEYDADPANVRSVFLFGHVAVPYSGDFTPDGHPDHRGAWAADTYYGDMNGNWTDSSVNSTSAERAYNRNTPGDGKFDQSNLPSDLELEVGRVDLANMTCFSNKTPSRSELDLLRQYLNKDHNFRQARLNVPRRGLVSDNFGERNGEAFAASGWRNFGALVGAPNVERAWYAQFFPMATANSYLLGYGTGGGSWTTCNGVGGSDDFANNDTKAVFTFFLGSYFGDWDNESAFLRAPLGGTSYTLTAAWAGRPHWFVHHMGLGETIGYGARLSANNGNSTYRNPINTANRQVHVALLGDPTLRLHPVVPASNVQATGVGGNASIIWAPSTDASIVGYHVYRGGSATGTFTRLTANPVTGTSFNDASSPAGSVYMVRAIKLETGASGTYYNASQGAFSAGGGQGPTAPAAPSNFAASASGASQIQLAWSDNSANETGFRVERKSGAAGTYAVINTTAINATSFSDSGLNAGTQYYYRLTALNATGASSSVEANATTTSGGSTAAGATFVTLDATTSGTWKGNYGAEGSYIATDSAILPGYAQVSTTAPTWTWLESTTDTRCLQRASGADRLAATWYSATSMNFGLRFTDNQTHRVAFYFLDWDRLGRAQTVEVIDASSGAVLDTRQVTDFGSGKYLVWDLKGNVTVRVTRNAGSNALVTGMFFGPVSATGGGDSNVSGSANGNNYNLRINGQSGQVYAISRSADLINWQPVSTVTLNGATYDYVDSSMTQTTLRFYKAVLQ